MWSKDAQRQTSLARLTARQRRMIDLREWLAVRTVAGELFSSVRPDVDDERLKVLKAFARKVLNETKRAYR